MTDARFLWAVLAALAVGGLAHSLAERFDNLLAYVDALAIGVYAVYGAIATTMLLRVLAIRFNWRTRAFGWRAKR